MTRVRDGGPRARPSKVGRRVGVCGPVALARICPSCSKQVRTKPKVDGSAPDRGAAGAPWSALFIVQQECNGEDLWHGGNNDQAHLKASSKCNNMALRNGLPHGTSAERCRDLGGLWPERFCTISST